MRDELRRAFEVFVEALDKELEERDTKINILESKVCYLTDKTDRMQRNMKDTAGVLAAAAQALQEGLNDY